MSTFLIRAIEGMDIEDVSEYIDRKSEKADLAKMAVSGAFWQNRRNFWIWFDWRRYR